MLSLSEELEKLSELFNSGILSEAEFKGAKEAIIRRFATATQSSDALPSQESFSGRPVQSQPQPQPLASSFGVGAYADGGMFSESDLKASFVRVDVREFDEDVIGEAQRSKAYKLMETILQNLQQYPQEPKYRRLRLSNPTLRDQLFAVPGSMCFLCSLGFSLDASGDFLSMPHPPPRDLLTEAGAALTFLRRRDAALLARTRDHARLRHDLALDLRRERCAKAVAVGELRAYLAREFCADDAGDGLHSSAAALATLRAALANAAGDPRRRRLRLANPAVRRAVVQQRGGLELLLEGAAAALEAGGDGGPVLVLRPDAAAAGIALVDEVAAAVRGAREARQREERAVAAEAMRAEIRRARRREGSAGNAGNAGRAPEDEEGEGAAQKRRAIPVAEAVQILLGKKRQENETAEGEN